jgi:molybdopterin converting factor small subunit
LSIKVNIFYPKLQQLTGQSSYLEVEGGTVGECLKDLMRQFPGAEKYLFDESGRILKHVIVYINAESSQPPLLSAAVKDGDTLLIAVLVTGG